MKRRPVTQSGPFHKQRYRNFAATVRMGASSGAPEQTEAWVFSYKLNLSRSSRTIQRLLCPSAPPGYSRPVSGETCSRI
jgi:hypothetical protein